MSLFGEIGWCPTDILTDDFVTLDFETTNLDKGDPNNPDNHLVLASIAIGTAPVVTLHGNEYEIGEHLCAVIGDRLVVAHYTKFELGWLERCGYDLTRAKAYCTMLGEYVILGNRKKPLDLDSVSLRYGGRVKDNFVKRLIKAGVCPSTIPRKKLAHYCEVDVDLCREVFLKQRQELLANGLLNVAYNRMILTPVLVDLEKVGLHLDADRVRDRHRLAIQEQAISKRKLVQLNPDINWASPQQVADYLYDSLKFRELRGPNGKPLRTTTDKRKASKEIIPKLKVETEAQRNFVDVYTEYRKADTALSKFLTKFLAAVEEDDCILQATFNQARTSTHRLSSTGKRQALQLQNLAREYKPLVSARNPEFEIGEADQAQLEFRVAGHICNDQQIRLDLANHVDVHAFTASVIEVTRQEAKSDTFKPLYGGSRGTPKQEEYYAAFKKKYAGVADAQEKWIQDAFNYKRLTMETGLVFYFDDLKVLQSGYILGSSKVCNYPVQNLATAEIVPMSLVLVWLRMKRQNMVSFLTNTVHDSVIGEIYVPEKELFKEIVVESFTNDVRTGMLELFDIDFSIPLEAEVDFSSHWGEH